MANALSLTEPELPGRCFDSLSHVDNLIVAVSGGSDSTALMHLVSRWRDQEVGRRPRILIATLDHGLRDGARAEMIAVRDQALACGFEHWSSHWAGEKPSAGLQAAARRARYQFFSGIADQLGGLTVVVTGHTQDDQAETVLMRLARGSGVDGLGGITDMADAGRYEICRPLLGVTREQLRQFLLSQGIGWIDDLSNASTAFERIRIRNATAARRTLNLSDTALALTARRLLRARRALDGVVSNLLRQSFAGDNRLHSFGVCVWPDCLDHQPDEIVLRLLRRIVWVLGGQQQPPSLSRSERLLDDWKGSSFRGATLGGCRLSSNGEGATPVRAIFREAERTRLGRIMLRPGQSVEWDRRFLVTREGETGRELEIGALERDGLIELMQNRDVELIPGIPRDVLLALPVVRERGDLIAVPALGWSRDGSLGINSEFLAQKLLDSARDEVW